MQGHGLDRDAAGTDIGQFRDFESGDDAVAYTRNGQVRVPPRKVDVVDTIGAGDTFNAGILAALHEAGLLAKDRLADLSEAQVRSAVSFANAAAAVTVSRAGANPPWRSEIA